MRAAKIRRTKHAERGGGGGGAASRSPEAGKEEEEEEEELAVCSVGRDGRLGH
ncbi:hypothetical protein SPI_05192 [Niveomyces insectorum RCEF 264]|uniref:Uncharacterized protein n=1 Tax=Niveomyces insectorum RCEF 264 TaxID=1081102 RepID=A0A167U205_9HYPO|nr:hypothetical protein SPI_05192 [Niveomyces insectorum RCEF 264]